MKRVVVVIASLATVMIAIALWLYFKPHASVDDEEPAFTISASKLVEEFHQDEAAADARYTGKVLQVRGRVREVIHDRDLYIVVLGDPDEMAGVSCSVQKENMDAEPQAGQTVSIKGICNGMLIDVVLDKAIMLPGPATNQQHNEHKR